MTKDQTTKTQAVTTRHCNCGCGEATSSSKTQYKPGHDARHAGIVARAMAAAKINGDATYTPGLDTLPSPKLRSKAEAMARRIVEQVAAKATKAKTTRSPKAAGEKADRKATAALVAQEEAEHAAAEAEKRAAIEAELEAEEVPFSDDSTVKIGRWEYPVRNWADGRQERNTKRDGSGEWIPYTA